MGQSRGCRYTSAAGRAVRAEGICHCLSKLFPFGCSAEQYWWVTHQPPLTAYNAVFLVFFLCTATYFQFSFSLLLSTALLLHFLLAVPFPCPWHWAEDTRALPQGQFSCQEPTGCGTAPAKHFPLPPSEKEQQRNGEESLAKKPTAQINCQLWKLFDKNNTVRPPAFTACSLSPFLTAPSLSCDPNPF